MDIASIRTNLPVALLISLFENKITFVYRITRTYINRIRSTRPLQCLVKNLTVSCVSSKIKIIITLPLIWRYPVKLIGCIALRSGFDTWCLPRQVSINLYITFFEIYISSVSFLVSCFMTGLVALGWICKKVILSIILLVIISSVASTVVYFAIILACLADLTPAQIFVCTKNVVSDFFVFWARFLKFFFVQNI